MKILFFFFDDFEGSSLSGEKWITYAGSPSVSNSILELSGGTEKVYSVDKFSPDIRIYSKVYYTYARCMLLCEESSGDINFEGDCLTTQRLTTGEHVNVENEGSNNHFITVSLAESQWNTLEARWQSDYVSVFENGVLLDSANMPYTSGNPDGTPTIPIYYYVDSSDSGQFSVDWVAVGKFVSPEPAHGDWGHEQERFTFPDDWQYRKNHTIVSNVNAGVDYPVRVITYYGSGTDGGENVYLNGHCRADFGDVRFADQTGWTLLDCWMETRTATYAIFWVKISTNLSVADTTIYVYYGNPDAARADDPLDLDVFQLREYDQWATSGWDPNIVFLKDAGTKIRVDSYTAGASPMGRGYVFIQAKRDYLNGKRLEMNWRCYYSYAAGEQIGFVHVVDNAHLRTKITGEFADNDNILHPISDYTSVNPLFLVSASFGWTNFIVSRSDVLDLSGFESEYVTILISSVDAWIQQKTILDVDYLKILNPNNVTLKTFDFNESVVMEQTGTLRDYGLYRKYVAGYEPHGDWEVEQDDAPWYRFAFLIWGTRTYPSEEENYYGFEYEGAYYNTSIFANSTSELNLSGNVSAFIRDFASDTNRYANCSNFWGDLTQQQNVYNAISACEITYNYTAIFYKGHGFNTTLDGQMHYYFYDNETDDDPDNWILDNSTYASMTTFTHDFVFLWACFQGNEQGGFYDDESWGMVTSWMGFDDLSEDGYLNPDYSDHVFISFANVSIDFIVPTGFSDRTFAHFAYQFFDYALTGQFTIRDALDLAAEDTINMNFGSSDLYNGYCFYYYQYNNQTETYDRLDYESRMRIYGDGEYTLPS